MSYPKVKLGLLLPTRGLLIGQQPPGDAGRVLGLARVAEAAGMDSVWVGDSLTAKPRMEPLTTLAAVASCTSRVRLGTAVLLAALRHPVLLAQTIGTVDLISRGRLVIAAGVGGAFNDDQKGEWRAAGVAPSGRASRLEEIVQIVKAFSSGQSVSFQGRHFDLEGVTMKPSPVQPAGVPFLLACHWRAQSDRQLERAARLGDGLISISDTPEEYARVVQRVRAIAAGLGREPDRLESVFYLTVNMGQDIASAEAEANRFLMGYYGANIWGNRWGPFGGPERVKERIAEYAAAGAETLVVRFASFDPERQLDTFLSQVAPAFA